MLRSELSSFKRYGEGVTGKCPKRLTSAFLIAESTDGPCMVLRLAS